MAGAAVSGVLERVDGFGPSSAALLFLNLFDGVVTTLCLQLGLAQEANPVMRLAYEGSPLGFMLVKLAVVQVGVLLLWVNRRSRAAQVALQLGASLYAAIACWHLAFLARLLLH